MDQQDLNFARGFALSDQPLPGVPDRFIERRLDGRWLLVYDPKLSFSLASTESGHWLVLLGTAVDVLDGEADPSRLAARLGDATGQGDRPFFNQVDRLSGRFVCIWYNGDSVRLLHDATGLRSVCYSWARGSVVVASHAVWVGSATNAPESVVQRLRFRAHNPLSYKFGFPGCTTPYADVHVLIPNTLLDLTNQRVERYWPRAPVARLSVDEALETMLPMLERQVKWLASGAQGQFVASLTAGIDSRLSLAVCKPWLSQARFFTYRRPGNAKECRDSAVAQTIAARLGLRHEVMDTTELADQAASYEHFEAALRSNCYYHHNRAVAYLYAKRFGGEKAIHLRSNVSDIGRGGYEFTQPVVWRSDYIRVVPKNLWRQFRRRFFGFDARSMVYLYRRELLGEPEVIAAFQQCLDLTSFDQRCGYDPYDLFYWEHRMGTWHSQLVLESDPAFETHVLYNSRLILQAMLGVALPQRRQAMLFKRIIERRLPELADIPVNPVAWPASASGAAQRR